MSLDPLPLAALAGTACCSPTTGAVLADSDAITLARTLKALTQAGLVTRDRRGVWALCALVPGAVAAPAEHLDARLTAPAARTGA